MLPLGSEAPPFSLPDVVKGKNVSLKDVVSDKATLVMFICNHCPYVIHVIDEIIRVANDYIPKGVSVIAISSNDAVAYPEDGPDKMKMMAMRLKYPFPYLYDESQNVARAFDAACTPDFFLFDGDKKLVYRGRLDDSRPRSGTPLTGKDLRGALDAVLEGRPVVEKQYPSGGCNIKWKK
jgi:thiol-disulfide isomerase/thioredoxin